MIDAKAKKFLEELLMTCGPSGFEFEQAKVYRDYLRPFAHDIRTDVLGNTVARLNPDAKFQFMLSGHYDEIGFQVVSIMPQGLISFRPVGGIDPLTLPGTGVEILTEKGHIPGVIGRKPIHLQTPDERKAVPKIEDLWIDIGTALRSSGVCRWIGLRPITPGIWPFSVRISTPVPGSVSGSMPPTGRNETSPCGMMLTTWKPISS